MFEMQKKVKLYKCLHLFKIYLNLILNIFLDQNSMQLLEIEINNDITNKSIYMRYKLTSLYFISAFPTYISAYHSN